MIGVFAGMIGVGMLTFFAGLIRVTTRWQVPQVIAGGVVMYVGLIGLVVLTLG